jgi:hypothetical protein
MLNKLADSPPQQGWPLHGLVSLWEMLTFYLSSVVHEAEMPGRWINNLSMRPENESVDESTRETLQFYLADLIRYCNNFDLTSVVRRCERLQSLLSSPLTNNGNAARELKVISEMIEDHLRDVQAFYVSSSRQKRVSENAAAWSEIQLAFPSIDKDLEQALDCYFFEQSTATVFHTMRVAERGLFTVADERGIKSIGKKNKPLTEAQWGEILDAVEGELKRIKLAPVAQGLSKKPAIEFYQGVLAHGMHLKDRYRNCVMHSNRSFSDGEAEDALFHTRSFMTVLAEKLSEENEASIDWGL